MSNVAVLGSGGFGLALAIAAHSVGHRVTVWSAFANEIEMLRLEHEHKKLLPGVKISEEINLVTDIKDIAGNDIVIFAIPSAYVRMNAKTAAPYIGKAVVVNVGKGLEEGTMKRMSEVLGEEIPDNDIVILSGPSHAEEVAIFMPTTITASSKNIKAAEYIQEQLSSPTLRIYINDDMVGCELGGALKNIIALCAGICDGMKYGDNTKAALMTRGIAEIARLGFAMGADVNTFAGLTGIGDLIVTCTSMHSRNRRAGILIGSGVSPEDAVKQIGTVEGYTCAKVAYQLCTAKKVDMPITTQLYKVLFEGKDVKKALTDLMGRPKCHESEIDWISEIQDEQAKNK